MTPAEAPTPLIRTAMPARQAAPETADGAPEPAAHLAARGFGLRYGTHQALHDISFEIPEHRVTAIIGPSGCGKSTFLRSFNRMNDLIPNVGTSGELRVGSLVVNTPSTDVVALRRRVGMVFQRPNPFPQSVFDNVAFGLRLLGVRQRSVLGERVEASLRRAAASAPAARLGGSAVRMRGASSDTPGPPVVAGGSVPALACARPAPCGYPAFAAVIGSAGWPRA